MIKMLLKENLKILLYTIFFNIIIGKIIKGAIKEFVAFVEKKNTIAKPKSVKFNLLFFLKNFIATPTKITIELIDKDSLSKAESCSIITVLAPNEKNRIEIKVLSIKFSIKLSSCFHKKIHDNDPIKA
jgi:hypothetical protein